MTAGPDDPHDGPSTQPLRVDPDPRPPSERTRPRQRVVAPPPFAPAPPPYGWPPPQVPGPPVPQRRARWPWVAAAAVVVALGAGVGTVAVLDPFGETDAGAAVGDTERDDRRDGGEPAGTEPEGTEPEGTEPEGGAAEEPSAPVPDAPGDATTDVPFGTTPTEVRAQWSGDVGAGWSPTFQGADGTRQWRPVDGTETAFTVYQVTGDDTDPDTGASGDDARRTQAHLQTFEDDLYAAADVSELVVSPAQEVTIPTADGGTVAALQQETTYTTPAGRYFSRYVARALADGTVVGYQLVTPTAEFDEADWTSVTSGLALEIVTG
ncbi:hypothetical protein [Nocardioides alkalitolerans]|uniref:hypothetical protein n=1 Tax=Nocardioides alkalitolerans TaxID=281714 RepID=UPI00040DCD51|nr:hypothetical protein [Nocardioides alkalitolerans]